MVLDWLLLNFLFFGLTISVIFLGLWARPWMLCHSWSPNFPDSFPSSILVGFLLLTAIVSAFQTNLNTVHLGIFCGAASSLIFRRKTKRRYQKPFNAHSFVLLFFSLFLLQLITSFISLVVFYPSSVENDVLFYSLIVENLHKFGIENYFHYFNDSIQGVTAATPYHYAELWIANLVYQMSDFSSPVILQVGIYPWILSLSIMIFVSGIPTFQTWKSKIGAAFIFQMFFLMTPSLVLNFLPHSWSMYFSPWLRPNFVPYLLVFSVVFLELNQKNVAGALEAILFLPILSIITVPGVLLTTPIILGFLYWKGVMKRNQALYLLCQLTLLAIFLILFYGLQDKVAISTNSDGIGFFDALRNSLMNWKAFILVSFSLIWRIIVFFALSIFVLFLIDRSKWKTDVIPLGALAGVAMSSMLSILLFQCVASMDNTYQFPYFSYAGFWALLSAFIIQAAARRSKNTYIVVIIIAGLFAFISIWPRFEFPIPSRTLGESRLARHLSPSDIEELASQLAKHHHELRIGYAYTDKEVEASPPKRLHALTFSPANVLLYLRRDLQFIPMTPSRILYGSHSFEELRKAKGFNSLVSFYRNEPLDRNQYINFMRENQISLFWRNGKLFESYSE